MDGVDITPITDQVIGIIAAVLSALAVWIGWYIKNWVAQRIDLTKTQIDEQLQQTFNEAAQRAIAYAETVVKGAVPTKVHPNNEFVETAADYLVKFWPDLVKRIGFTPENVRDTILARLPSGDATNKVDAIVLAKAAGSASTAELKK